jgi:XTP/dITP diphosphohydrolase
LANKFLNAMRLFIASANPGKIREIQAILQDSELELLSARDEVELAALGVTIPAGFDVLENGQTFQENALLKAKAYAELTGLATIADDSGLEVEALNGFPSVNSNRWFAGTPAERNLALLDLLKDKASRQARFYSVLCYFEPKTSQHQFFEGEILGQIAPEPRGSKLEGFGYDPIFIPQGYEKTFAELGADFKNNISHRREALFKLNQFLLSNKHLGRLE